MIMAFAPAAPAARLDTAFLDPWSFDPHLSGSAASLASFQRAHNGAGARYARLTLNWRAVAPDPNNPIRPTFDASHPSGQGLYNWSSFDEQINAAAAAGIEPIVYIERAPEWAENNGLGTGGRPSGAKIGMWKPSPSEFGAFAHAAAQRYSGTFCDPSDASCNAPCDALAGEICLPRVRFWQALNEPNRVYNLYPQYVNGKPFSPRWYRWMVNAFAAGVHSVAGNVVVAGGQAALKQPGSLAPMTFMRKMLCMSKPPYRRVCSARSIFDAWSHHPYACGGPNRQAFSSDNIAVADLPEMRRLLLAAIRTGRVQHIGPVRYWVTELGWITKPPRSDGVPLGLHARWTAEGLYRSWRAHVSLVTWFPLVDRPKGIPGQPWQSGLYYANLSPKPRSLLAYRFPFVTYVRSGRVYTWGRMPPEASPQYVLVQRRTSSGWRTIGRAWAGGAGLFSKTLRTRTSGTLRARITIGGSRLSSNPFSLTRPRDPYICAFGNG
jgi:hypothetical protein